MEIDSQPPSAMPSPPPAATAATTAIPDFDPSDPDPITATYNVYINPTLPTDRQLIILQQPNRAESAAATTATTYSSATSGDASTAAPAAHELRLKPRSGIVELEVPLNPSAGFYDRAKGVRWGKNLAESAAQRTGGAIGLAGGFGIGTAMPKAPTGRGGKKGAAPGGDGDGGDGDEDSIRFLDWSEALRLDKVLRTQTLGGQVHPDTKNVQYMVGVFQGEDLHLTPVSSLVHLRPQHHHIDSTALVERAAQAKDSAGGAGGAGAGAPQAARAIQMSIKSAGDGGSGGGPGTDGVSTETIADRLRNVQREPWRRMRYVDENDETAWDTYNDNLLLAGLYDDDNDDAAAPTKLPPPTLHGIWASQRLLEEVSGMRPHAAKPRSAPATPHLDKGKGTPRVKFEEGTEPQGPRRGARTAPVGARRGGTAANAMQID